MNSGPASSTTTEAFFEKMYSANPDPWNFAGSPYEQSRYDTILAALDKPRYRHAFEPACAVGELTRRLASRCDRVDATDISPTAIAQARQRCANFPNVHFQVGALPHLIPDSLFDLIVFSEVGYYFEEVELRALTSTLLKRLAPNGTFLAAHWLGSSADHLLSGDRVHELLAETLAAPPNFSTCEPGFRLDRWTIPTNGSRA